MYINDNENYARCSTKWSECPIMTHALAATLFVMAGMVSIT